jgi:anti-sigma factor RsiW
MKDCEAMVIELPGYISGKLSAEEAAPVRAHLEMCGGCRSEVASLRRLEQLLSRALPSIEPSPTFASTFANRLAAEVAAEEEAASHGWLGWLLQPWLIPVAAAALLAAVIFRPFGDAGAPLSFSLPRLAQKPPAEHKAPPAPGDKALASNPPSELLQRPEMFVDYSVIRDLDILESGKGDSESHNG